MKSKNNRENIELPKINKQKFIISCILILLCIFIVTHLFTLIKKGIFNSDNTPSDVIEKTLIGEDGKTTTITKTSIEKVFEISELSTADYTYNAIAKAYNEDNTEIKYYVAYEGIVKAGIDFNEINIQVNNEEKIISLTIPDVEIKERTVNPSSLEYIFKDKKSETENVFQEAFKLCEKDLADRIDKEEELFSLARENALSVVEALLTPWVIQLDDEYEIEIQ